MKISIESARAGYLNNINTNVKTVQTAQVHENGRNFDKLVISSNSRQVAEEQLAAAANKEAHAAVFKPVSEEKIAALKQQVADGLYKVDPDAVAAKIVMFGGR